MSSVARMGGVSAKGRAELARVIGRGGRTVTVDEVASCLGISRQAAAMRLARWASQGWLRRVRRGMYIPVPLETLHPEQWSEDPLVLADSVWAPCFFTGWTAANHWGLTEQVFRTTVVKTARRVRHSDAQLLDHRFLLVHTDETSFWALENLWREDRRLRMADPARTVVDVLDSPRLGGGIRHVAEIVAAYLDAHEAGLLVDYGDRLGNMTVFKRLGHVLERLGLGPAELLAACRERIPTGISLLDPSGPRGGERVNHWGIRANVTLSRLDAT